MRRELELYVRRNMSNLSEVRTANLKGEFVLRAYIRERHPEIVPGPYSAIPEDRLRWALGFEARRNLKTYAAHVSRSRSPRWRPARSHACGAATTAAARATRAPG